jgi:hypothetical protein
MTKTLKNKSNKLNHNLVGGLKQKNTSLTSWQAVYKMVCVEGASLTVISFHSITGFIFKLDVPQSPENSEFYGLNEDGTAFNNPIYSLVFKFVIISNNDKDELKRPFELTDENGQKNTFKKEMLTLREIMYEAYIQQEIYKKTLYPVGRPITIGILDFAYFDKTFAEKLVQKLYTLQNKNAEVRPMLNYLLSHVKGDRLLGLITMDLVNSGFTEMKNVIKNVRDVRIINSDSSSFITNSHKILSPLTI